MIQSSPLLLITTGPSVSTLRLLLKVPPDGVGDITRSVLVDATSFAFESKTWSASNKGCEGAAATR